MSVTVTACYLVNIIIDIVLIFLISINVIEFDEIKTSKKNAVEQCNSLNPLVTALIFCLEIFILIYSLQYQNKWTGYGISWNSKTLGYVFFIPNSRIAILLMRPTLCRSKQCCQVLAIKDKVMNE